MKQTLLVVADDLTGANDSSVTFAEAGFDTLLALSPSELNNAFNDHSNVYAVSTDTRANLAQAAEITAKTVQGAMKNGVNRLYLKIDSTMRGSVSGQIGGAVQAWQSQYDNAVAVICPAYPVMGRTIENGRLLVNGVPVQDTPSGKDAICPVLTEIMTELLPGSVSLPCNDNPQALAEAITASGASQVIVDAKSEADLDQIAAAIALIGDAALPVGSAGLARAVAKTMPLPTTRNTANPLPVSPPVLIVVTSIHDTSQQQVDEYIASFGARSAVFSPHPAQLQADSALSALEDQIEALLAAGSKTVIIRANPSRYPAVTNPGKVFAERLARLAIRALEKQSFGALVLFGGDGSAALLEQMQVQSLQVLRPMVEGVPLATICGTAYDGLPVLTKSGGFGNPDLLCQIMAQLT